MINLNRRPKPLRMVECARLVALVGAIISSGNALAQAKPSLLILPPAIARVNFKIEAGQGPSRASDDLKKEFIDHIITQLQACLQKTERFDIKDREFLDDINDEKKKILRGDVQFDEHIAGELGVNFFLRIKSVDLDFSNGFGVQTKLSCSIKVALANAQGKVIGQLIEHSDRALGAYTEPLDPTNAGDSRYDNAFTRIGNYIAKSLPKDKDLVIVSPSGSSSGSSIADDHVAIDEAYKKSKFLVIITDSTVGQESGGPANSAIAGKLTNFGLNVIDKDASNDLLDQAKRESQKQTLSEAFLNSLRRRYGADYVLVGSAISESTGVSGSAGSVFVTHLNVRLIRIDDARTIFSDNQSGRAQELATESGRRTSAENAGSLIATKLLAKLKSPPAELSAPKGDEELNLIIRDIGSYLLSSKLVKAIQGLENVVGAVRTAYADASVTIRLTVKHGETDSVLTELSESKAIKALLSGHLSIKSVTDNNVQMSVSRSSGG